MCLDMSKIVQSDFEAVTGENDDEVVKSDAVTATAVNDTEATANAAGDDDGDEKSIASCAKSSEGSNLVPRKINSGRWTSTEHELFLEGLKKYGREWKRVAGNVGTRSVMQTRTHAQKHFDRLKPGGNRGGIWKTNTDNKEGTSSVASKKARTDSYSGPSTNVREDDEGLVDKEGQEMGSGSRNETQRASPNGSPMNDRSPYLPGDGMGSVGRQSYNTSSPGMQRPHPFPGYSGGAGRPMPGSSYSHSSYSDVYGASMPGYNAGYSNVYGGSDSFTDEDILLPMSHATMLRKGNKEYLDVLKANYAIFHSLPGAEQAWFARNICQFLHLVRGRRLFYTHQAWGTPNLVQDPVLVVSNEFRVDALKSAAFQFHPLWILGEHDPGSIHKGEPFLYRHGDGSWIPIMKSDVKEVLKNEGPKNLLLLPTCVPMPNNANRRSPIKSEN